jgi:nicotinamidase-related amidase
LQYTEDGSWGQEFVAELSPGEGELVIKKFRSSGFVGTPLDLLLRSNGIETIVICGCTTEGCVESTARDGMFLDYYVVVVPDCVESDTREQHEASLTLMRARFDMLPSPEIRQVWDGAMARRTAS